MKKKIGYLSGAPRVSTRPEAEAAGPRSHVVGVIEGFKAQNWEVNPFIVGDRVPLKWIHSGSQKTLQKNFLTRSAADIVRIGINLRNRRIAVRNLGSQMDWVYERLGAFQSLGRGFQRRGIPWILETNAPQFFEAQNDRDSVALGNLARKSEIEAYRRCDVLVAITDTLKEIIIQEAGIEERKIVVMPNGVNTNRFDPQRASPKRFFDYPTIIFVGGVRTWQGLSLLITAISELQKVDIQYGLIIVGDGPAMPQCKTLVEKHHLHDQVKFLGRVPWEEVPNYIASGDLGYSGRIRPKFGQIYFSPLKLYEYQAMGKPVIAAAQQDAKSVLIPEQTGFLFDPENLEDLIAALHRAYQVRSDWPKMGEQARKIILNKHSWENRIREFIPQAEAIIRSKYGIAYPQKKRM
jgi:glycosyltransferase involved in cell wall biosynthesis